MEPSFTDSKQPAMAKRDPPPLATAGKDAGIFTPDSLAAFDAFGHDEALAPLAEFVVLASAATPMTIGLFGGPGSGKSSAAARLRTRIETLAGAAARAAATKYVTRVLGLRLSASDLTGDPAVAIANGLRAGLTRADAPAAYAAIAAEAENATTDPHIAARDITTRLDSTRDRLDIERKALDDLEGRKARLHDSILYETAGSGIDAYARANRGVIDTRMRLFGFDGDSIAHYKELAREAGDHPGAWGKLSAFANATWAFKGQARLIIWAIVLYLLAELSRFVEFHSDTVREALRGLGDTTAEFAPWFQAHLSWLTTLRQIAIPIALALIALNVWRAIRFLSPIWRGARLLLADVSQRRGQIENAVAHQTRRVDTLSREVEGLADAAARAQTRIDASAGRGAIASSLDIDGQSPEARARAFIGFLADAAGKTVGAPQRFVCVIDGLDAVAPARAAELVETCQRLLALDGFVTVIAADPSTLIPAFGGPSQAAEKLDRLINLPVNLPEPATNTERMSAFTRALLNGAAPAGPVAVDIGGSGFDSPLTPVEVALVSSLAPLAAGSPRAAKRFANLYRLARGRAEDRPALALALALDSGATSGELGAMGKALDGQVGAELAITAEQPRLAFALEAVNKARGARLTIGAARAAWAIARDYRMPA